MKTQNIKKLYYNLRCYLLMAYYRLFNIQPNVYNLKVEDVPEFYANDILVHNCPLCFPLEGKKFKLDQIESMIPRHPSCRCVAIPLVDKEARDAKTITRERGEKLGDDNIAKGKDALRS